MKLLLLLPLFFCATFTFSQDATFIYKNTVNSTVTIETDNSLGSGFFVSDYIIATNYHVIEGASFAFCYTNNSSKKYKIEGYLAADKSVDLILLKVSGLNRTPLKMAASQVSPGQKVYALGSPKGLPATISDGIVSGLRDFEGYKLIQMTAPISPGSSGGPVLNQQGELVGVSVSQLQDGQNLNFAIPKSNVQLLLSYKQNNPSSFSSLYPNKKRSNNDVSNYYGTTDKKEASNKEIQWLSFDELQVAMKKNPKKVFMDVYTDWCGWCKKMEKSTFTNPEVIKYINEHYYAIRFNAEQKEPIRFMGKTYETKPGSNTNELAIELLHGQMSYPTTVIFEENFLNPQPIPGYLDVPTCEMIVKYLGENLYRTKGFADYQKEFKATWH